MTDLNRFKEYFAEFARLRYISQLLNWDQQVYMPDGSSNSRAEQIAMLEGLIHEKLVSEKAKDLIKEAEKVSNLNLVDNAHVREVRREYDKATKVPGSLVKEMAKTASLGEKVWEKAKQTNDYQLFKPYLKKMVELEREYAEKINVGPTPYDTLIDAYEPDSKSSWIAKVFDDLKPKLVKIVNKIESSSRKPETSVLSRHYPAEKQWNFTLEILKRLNFDFNIGRQDKSVHPFTASVSSRDIRITTKILENFLPACLFGTIHEGGHALYEMGFMEDIHDTILADGSSFGVHESQSRLWENIIGRSLEFWKYWFPLLQKQFPENLKGVSSEQFYGAINTVERSLIRIEADEVTYSLHIILRFELEKCLINDVACVDDLPSLWNQKMDQLLKIVPPNDSEGVLQDVHWSSGAFGYFPSYALGNLYGAQLYRDALKRRPSLPEEFEKGDFSGLLGYLRENVHKYGKVFRPLDLIKKVTNETLNPKYFIEYLEKKFYEIYK